MAENRKRSILGKFAEFLGINRGAKLVPNKGESDMTDKERKAVIDNLVANVCCWDEDDREVLNELSDEKLTGMAEQAEKEAQAEAVVNAAKKGFTDPGGNTHTWNEEKAEWETKEKVTINKEDKKENKPPTEEEWLTSAPEGVREDLQFARNEKSKQKAELVKQLTANIKEDKQRREQEERLQTRGLEDLRQDVALLPPKQEERAALNYQGAAAPAVGQQSEDDKKDILPLPTMNFEEEQKKKQA